MNTATIFSCIAGASLLTGCASSLFDPATPGYDTQGCVEDALRRSDDVELVRAASAEFERACRDDDGAACSALGVIIENGALTKPDTKAARGLYARACTLDNLRGCVNLGRLDERRGLGEEDASRIRALYGFACANGEQSGCAALGRSLAHGGAKERDRAIELLGGACGAGRADACFELAELERRGAAPGPVALQHYALACIAGHMMACERLDPQTQVASR
jgi:hypothetical protein